MRMSNETKAIFAAPWTIEEEAPLAWYCVIDSKDSVVANDVRDQKTVNRLARLPELYDALMEAAYEHCRVCIYGHAKNARQMPKPDDMARNGCTLSDFPYCPNRNWWNLLKNVRDGK